LRQFSLDAALESASPSEDAQLASSVRRQLYSHYLTEARRMADAIGQEGHKQCSLQGEMAELQFFSLAREI
ncbi:MAG: hypothetical protein HKN13_11495, partial [Rhodothermales bacterium]|nr:hypothetical protein [Rhodothermales bacterium]